MNRELENLKVALVDLVADIQRLRRQHLQIDQLVSQAYKKARATGLQVKPAKALINELHGDSASADQIWSRYRSLTGIDDETAASSTPALDAILGPG
jgi:uncharacterized protein (UPF0335 family)